MKRFEVWIPGHNVVPDNESLMWYVFRGVDCEAFAKSWMNIEIHIKAMMESARHYAVAKSRFKK